MTERPDYQERVSVVIPMYQAGPWIAETLASVDLQTYPIYECIVVDDGSTDGTRDLLEELEGELIDHLIFHEKNAGKGAALRTGFGRATGDVVVVQDADLEYDPYQLPILF